jgi:hypothetical protein
MIESNNKQNVKTASDLIRVVDAYGDARYGPLQSGIRFGCDCGCGGDSYTSEQWDAEMEYNKQSIKDMIELCAKLGLVYDGIE